MPSQRLQTQEPQDLRLLQPLAGWGLAAPPARQR